MLWLVTIVCFHLLSIIVIDNNDDYCYELEEGLKCFLKCCINMKLPTFLFIKMRKGHWSLLLHMRDPKIRKRLLKSIISLICKCVNTLLAHLIHLGKHYYWFYKKFTTKRVDMQFTKQTTNKTIIDHSSTKTSLDSTWVDKTRRLLRSPDDF